MLATELEGKVWFITGSSQGLGFELVNRLLLETNCRVVATTRNKSIFKDLENQYPERLFAIENDITNEDSVKKATQLAVERFQRIDVLVNNAGFVQLGALEEQSNIEILNHLNVNLMSVFSVTRSILPIMRSQKSGFIFNISSIMGFTSCFPGNVAYSSGKFAMAGLSESLSREVAQFNIKVVIVYPGCFRTSVFKESSYKISSNPMPEYDTLETEKQCKQSQGSQRGDPAKFAKLLIKVSESPSPPLHLFVGQDSVNMAKDKIKELQSDMEKWEDLSTSTDFEPQKTSSS